MGLLPWQRGSLLGPLPTYRHLPNGWHPTVSLSAQGSTRDLPGSSRRAGGQSHRARLTPAACSDSIFVDSFFLSAADLLFGLEPVIEFRAGLIAFDDV